MRLLFEKKIYITPDQKWLRRRFASAFHRNFEDVADLSIRVLWSYVIIWYGVTCNVTVILHEHHGFSIQSQLECFFNSLLGPTAKHYQRSVLLTLRASNVESVAMQWSQDDLISLRIFVLWYEVISVKSCTRCGCYTEARGHSIFLM